MPAPSAKQMAAEKYRSFCAEKDLGSWEPGSAPREAPAASGVEREWWVLLIRSQVECDVKNVGRPSIHRVLVHVPSFSGASWSGRPP